MKLKQEAEILKLDEKWNGSAGSSVGSGE